MICIGRRPSTESSRHPKIVRGILLLYSNHTHPLFTKPKTRISFSGCRIGDHRQVFLRLPNFFCNHRAREGIRTLYQPTLIKLPRCSVDPSSLRLSGVSAGFQSLRLHSLHPVLERNRVIILGWLVDRILIDFHVEIPHAMTIRQRLLTIRGDFYLDLILDAVE